MEVPSKKLMVQPYDPAVPLLVTYMDKTNTLIQKGTFSTHGSTIYRIQDIESN